MKVIGIISTKGGVGKTTLAANLGAIAADAGLRVLLVDLDIQPTLSSYFTLLKRAEAGIYELLAHNEYRAERVISHTSITNLDLIYSNDSLGQLHSLLLHAPDGRLRLRHLLPLFQADYDLMLVDTQGARGVLLELGLLASQVALSPVIPEMLAARELQRGTLQLMQDVSPYRHSGIEPPTLQLLLNRVHPVSINAQTVQQALRQIFSTEHAARVLHTVIPAAEAYPRAAMLALPVHRVERRRPSGRVALSALETMRALACELLPEWSDCFARVSGTAADVGNRRG
jgi:chromosome partitioning related protein ParA